MLTRENQYWPRRSRDHNWYSVVDMGSGQLGPKTSRPRTTRPRKKSAQDNSAQVVPISEDNSAQIAEDHSAHKNQTRHLLMYLSNWIVVLVLLYV